MKYWQKGVFAGFIFSFLIGSVYAVILIIIDVMFYLNGIPHVCYFLSKGVICSFSEALLSRIGFLAVFMLVIGIPLSAFSGFLGYIVGRISMK